MAQILVTGGAGYIGSHTIVELIQSGYEPIILDDFRNSERFVIDRLEKLTQIKIKCYDLDCNNHDNLEQVFTENKIVGVIHFAAYKAVGESVKQPVKYYENNIGSLLKLLQVMEKFKVNHLVFSSSCTVYGEPKSGIVSEQSPLAQPKSPYGHTKLICEDILKGIIELGSSSLKVVLLRYFNPIGAHESGLIGELPLGKPNNLVPFITQSASGKRGELQVFGNDYQTPDGTCIRDFIHVSDLAEAHVRSLELILNENSNRLEIFNVGTGNGVSVLELIERFEQVNALDLNWSFAERRPGDVEKIYADNTKIKNSLNWSCRFTLDDALKHAWNWEKSLK
ncbi:MAG: UDP-glucose 4-epimerase GalE [Crocinitomicaceae bacterium]